MLRSRLLIRIAAFVTLALAAGCHSGPSAEAPTSHAETTSGDARAFPADDARTALNAASPGLRSCRKDSGTNVVDASVKFEPTGKVSSIDVKPADEPVASCVRTKLAEVSVMPFDGAPVTMSLHVRM